MKWPWDSSWGGGRGGPEIAVRQLVTALRPYRKAVRELVLSGGDPGVLPVTKIGGIPWWPVGRERPRCPAAGHLMSFVAQFRMSDVPGAANDSALLSFHYCQECTWEGLLSTGWSDEENRGYDVSLLDLTVEAAPDGLGMVVESVFPAARVEFWERVEVPQEADWTEAITELASEVPYDYLEQNGLLCFSGCKVGGWPCWDQESEWPETRRGQRMVFVAQLDYELGTQSAWGGGGHAYLFVTPPETRERKAELHLQFT